MERIIAIDVGLKRIGVAYNPYSDIVVPLNAIFRKNRNQAAQEISKLLKEYKATKLIIGIPLTNEEMQIRIKHFADLIDFDGEKIFIDESFTSAIVKEEIKGKIKHKRDGRIDSLAAKKILESYLKNNSIST